jgi:hypothetical protein
MHPLIAGVPQPPLNFRMSGAQSWFTVIQIIVAAGMLLYAAREARRTRSPLFLCFLLGGAISVLWEPLVDVLGQCYLPAKGQWHAFTEIGRPIPLMMPFVYCWFVGGQGYLFYRIFKRGIDARRLFWLWGMVALVNVALETPGLVADVYTYYGRQPLDIWGFPLWWAFVNPLMPMIAGATVYRLMAHLRTRWALAAVIAIVPMADGAANAAAGWPVVVALNTDVGYAGTWVAALVTLGLAALVVQLVALAVARPGAVRGAAEPTVAKPTETVAQRSLAAHA